ncbi:triacylglycerol lipase [Citricoccus muralis]|uniref:Triacylglycerol lipase n=1 Tax=Citricoccus muralis TaxID=169134 RepID=A0A3D9LG87_9MICC|nr:triacylglycerol lipase [Citricoccus muralis]
MTQTGRRPLAHSRPSSRSRPLHRGVALPAVALGLTASLFASALSASAAPAETLSESQEAAVEDVADAEVQDRAEAMEELAETTDTDFYATPATLPDSPGTLIRSEAMDFYLDPVKLIRHPATATRILYSSTNASGEVVPVSGTILVPHAAWKGKGERPVIGYGVGTQGLADRCAPSRALSTGQEYEGLVVSSLLSQGYTVVATDYEGLGTEGQHTYMVRESQGHAVLDSLRAAAQLPDSGVTAETPAALAGYSQGGGATASAAELAPGYAPELNLKGAYAGAVPADLFAVGDLIDGSLYSEFLQFAMGGQFAAAGIDPAAYLNEDGLEVLDEASENCTVDGLLEHPFLDSSDLTLAGQHLKDLIRSDATLETVISEQRIGDDRSPEIPVVISHSVLDDVIPYSTGRGLAGRWCDEGATVSLDTTGLPTHIGGYVGGIPRMTAFLQARFAGWSPVDSCWRL